MIVSNKIWEPQSYLEAMTGKRFKIDGDNNFEFITTHLKAEGFYLPCGEVWTYLDDIEHFLNMGYNCVLVDCMVYNETTITFDHEFAWFRVDGCEDAFLQE